ncbi:MAG: DUF3006 family protein [Candidatus Kuenenbacteria bacterium]
MNNMDEVFTKKNFLICTLDRFEGRLAVLKTEDNQSINWPIEKLPNDAEESSQIKLVLLSDKTEEKEREETIKAVLNEILKTE